jgi:hypothetical protein
MQFLIRCFLLFYFIAPITLFSSECGSTLAGDDSSSRIPKKSEELTLPLNRRDQHEILYLAERPLAGVQRSYSNSTHSFDPSRIRADPPDDKNYRQHLDTVDLFRDIIQREKIRSDGSKREWDEEVTLDKRFLSVARDVNAPVLDSKEIRARQEFYKELDTNASLKRDVKAWSEENNHIIENDRGFSSIMALSFRGRYIGDEGDLNKSYDLSILKTISELPAAMASAAKSLSSGQSTRARQLAWLANDIATDAEFLDVTSKLAKIAQKDSDSLTSEELRAAVQLAETLNENQAFKNVLYIGETLNSTIYMHDFARRSGWTHYPTVLDRDSEIGPILEITNGHAPRVLREKGNASIGNSIVAGGNQPSTIIATGPNAQGKSTYLRMAAQNLLLAQMGLPVPVQEMRFTPMSTYYHLNPPDAPSQNMSLFVRQSSELREKVFSRVDHDSFQLVVLDEILPGTTPEIREAAEQVFLKNLHKRGGLTLVATHNWGTTKLEEQKPQDFRNVHFDRYRVHEGPQQNTLAMIDGAAEALRDAGWSESEIAEFRALSNQNTQ